VTLLAAALAAGLAAGAGGIAGAALARRRWARAVDDLRIARNTLIRQLDSRTGDLDARRDEMNAVLESMTEGVLVLDAAGRVVLANHAVGALLGAAGDALAPGTLVHEIIRVPPLLDLVRPAAGEPRRGEVELPGPPARWLDVRVAPLAGTPTPGRLLAVLNDVTEFRRLDSVRRDFVANASHELKTPLAAIQGYAEVLQDESPSEEAGIILANARRLGKLVEDLLTISRVEARSFDLKLKSVSLGDLAARALPLVRPQAEARRIAVTAEIDPGLAALADEEALFQVVVNLLDNAIKYAGDGGWVEIGAASEPPDRVRLCVRDTGPGIPPEHLPRLFERFYRVDKARSRELGGTGLGLAIVKHLAESMGGEAYLTNRPGTGCEAGVRLPAASEPPAGVRLPAADA